MYCSEQSSTGLEPINKLNNLAISLALTRNILAIYKGNNSCKVFNIRIKSEMCKWSSPHDEQPNNLNPVDWLSL
jgi:hypothetical protein